MTAWVLRAGASGNQRPRSPNRQRHGAQTVDSVGSTPTGATERNEEADMGKCDGTVKIKEGDE